MAVSEAQKRAHAKYQKNKTKTVNLRFCPTDMDLLDFINTKDSKSGYIKQLIRNDMERSAR